MLLGCIGDDFTGSSDLANVLAKGGMRVTQYNDIPDDPADIDVQAGVVALKSRSANVDHAVEMSLKALNWLSEQGCKQFFFKYCSTFDSTRDGNIGPVLDALADALGADRTIVCPAFPGTGRSVYQGHLFVMDRLLNESGMENHPLTPMIDSDIRRWLQYQTTQSVGHVAMPDVTQGFEGIWAALQREVGAGHRHIVVDAINNADLKQIGQAAADLPLVSGGSGVALGLPANFGCSSRTVPWRGQEGKTVVLSGSCSKMTRAQVAMHCQKHLAQEIRAEDVIEGKVTPNEISDWLLGQNGIPLAYTSADPEHVAAVQSRYGRDMSASKFEAFFAKTAQLAVANGVTRIISAGGETSGAIVQGLSLDALQIGPEIDPGVPALRASDNLVVALKSGNFGEIDFFEKAHKVLSGG